jgi:hypothetical protein
LVELPQVRQRHLHGTHRGRLLRQVQWRWFGVRCGPPHALQNGLDIVAGFAAAPFDGSLHHRYGLLGQQLHHADIVFDAAPWPMLPLQVGAQLGK